MFASGKIFSLMTADVVIIMAGIRVISAVLGALVIVLAAVMTLVARKSRPAALVAATLVMLSSGFATIAHHAVVDIYPTFFVAVASFLLLQFVATQKDAWLYLGFFATGLAASSKYNGASLVLAATSIAVFLGAAHWRSVGLSLLGRLSLAYLLALLGFFIGTPHALLNAPIYLEQLVPFLERQRVYAGPRVPGIIGQWGTTLDGLGALLFLLFALATLWGLIRAAKYVWALLAKREIDPDGRFYLALLLILFAFELPIALSQFYPMRYMVPAYPLLAVLSAVMLNDLWGLAQNSSNKTAQRTLILATIAVIFFSALRFASVILTFANDSRIAASKALPEMIPPGSRTEYTLYPPLLPTENRVIDNYPLRVFKFDEDIATYTGWNMGEKGIELRKPEYLVVDRKTYSRFFEDDHVCRLNSVECEFFTRLLNEETNYKLVQRFEYRVPPYLPQVKTDHANIEVLLYERRAKPISPHNWAAWHHPLNAQFGEDISLHGYDLEQTAENQLLVSLFWSTSSRLAENYKVFVHCLGQDGQIVAQSDSIPAGGSSPTEYWMRDELIRDDHIIHLPAGNLSSDCHLRVGLYLPQTGERLPSVIDGSLQEDGTVPLANQ